MPKLVQKNNTIPSTRLISWSEFNSSGQKKTIKNYILHLLGEAKTPMSCRMISEASGIEVQSLTRALQELVIYGHINTDARVTSKTNRLVIAYSLNHENDSNV